MLPNGNDKRDDINGKEEAASFNNEIEMPYSNKDLAADNYLDKLKQTHEDGDHPLMNGVYQNHLRVGEKRTRDQQRVGSSSDINKDDFIDKYSLKESNYGMNGQLQSSCQPLLMNGHKESHNGDTQ